MPYATPTDLLSIGAAELAQLAAPDDNRVTADLLRLTIESGDRSAYSAAEQAAADMAVAELVKQLDRASRRIDSYLAPRYPLPLDAALIAGSDLPQTCVDITRYLLTEMAPSDVVLDRYKGAMTWLRDLSTNRASLGSVDTGVATPAGRPVLRQGVSGHDWNTY